MLLPSDVARLVLGYLQQEKLPSTCRAFISESSHLKEYADHHTDDGAIPGCLLSLFGKNLTTILNEYITMKAKENEADVPYMMSSLWKKLDLTLSQIRCMQESSAFQTNQRARTRKGINDRLRQKMLTSPLAVSASTVSHPVAQQISTPVLATQYILCPINTPVTSQSVSTMSTIGQPAIPSGNPVTTTSSTVETTQTVSVASTQTKLPITATSSPMRRKPDTQRRRRLTPISGSAPERDVALDTDSMQGLIDDGFPQMVIENAREKILSNKCLQEKLAENINKILASDSVAQTSKQGDGTPAEQDASIDEILGLQGGEIHMSEEAIHDILVQTELDPDFQELYDLFACVSTKAPKSTPRDPSSSQNVDAKAIGSEKSKKQVVAEDANSREQVGNMEDCLRGRETNNCMLNDHNAEISLKEKADRSSTLQKMCVNDCASSGSSNVHRQSSDLVISIENSDSDTGMEITKESSQTVLEVSYIQSHDVEMENISPSNECTDDCFIVEDASPPAMLSPTKSEPMSSKGSENEEPSEMSTSKGTTNEKLSDKSQQETNKHLAASQPPTMDAMGNILLIAPAAPALNCSSTQNEKDHQPTKTSKISPLNKLCDDAKYKQGNENGYAASIEKDTELQKPIVNVVPAACHEQNSRGPEMEPCSAGITIPGSSQEDIDPSTIVTLDIITEDFPEEAEMHSAVRSIHEENYPTIILSPLVKNQDIRRVAPTQNSSSGDIVESSVVGEQCQLLTTSTDGTSHTINIPNGDCTVYAVSGTSTTADGSVIQLMPSSTSTFAPSNSLYISSCVPAKQPNIMMLSNSTTPNTIQKQAGLFQTPPRPGSIYTVGQAISPKISQGSTIILASPVQPMLQGVMSMFPISLVGQSGSTFTTQPHQILHVPISKPMIPKLPLPPKSQKSLPKPAANTGKPSSNPASDSMSRPSILVHRENEEKNPFAEIQKKLDERALPETLTVVPKSVEAHRRVLCFDGSSTLLTSNPNPSSTNAKSQKDKNDTIQNALSSTEASFSKISLSKETRKIESSAPSMGKNTRMDISASQAKDLPGEKRPTSSGGGHGVNKENVLQGGEQIHPAGQMDKKTTSQENLRAEKIGKPSQEPVRKQTSLPNILRRTPQKMPSERICSTSPLAKQASQLLQDIQFHSPNTKSRSTGDAPRTPGLEDKLTDNNSDHTRTPMSRRCNEDGGTPKPMMPLATPDLPTCSPASEAGSENSVNMAAHTLMILSRASISKASSSTPVKDNTRQSKPSKSTAKKRRLEDSDEYERRSHRKELLSPSSSQKKKKMKKQRKKSEGNFPPGMDVEKFLMSLHYDE
ncbi:protein NPAT [Mantella aurantiaca]